MYMLKDDPVKAEEIPTDLNTPAGKYLSRGAVNRL